MCDQRTAPTPIPQQILDETIEELSAKSELPMETVLQLRKQLSKPDAADADALVAILKGGAT